MTDKPDYIHEHFTQAASPPAQPRVIRSEIIHSMPVKDLISWVGEVEPSNALPDSITVELSHAF